MFAAIGVSRLRGFRRSCTIQTRPHWSGLQKSAELETNIELPQVFGIFNYPPKGSPVWPMPLPTKVAPGRDLSTADLQIPSEKIAISARLAFCSRAGNRPLDESGSTDLRRRNSSLRATYGRGQADL